MTARVSTMEQTDRCDLCGVRVDGSFRDRLGHLRSEHPAYARGLLLRVLAPGVFLLEVLALALVKAPQWAFLVALFCAFGVLFIGKQRSRAERKKSGAPPTLPMKRLLREGGLGFLMILPVIALLIVVLSKG